MVKKKTISKIQLILGVIVLLIGVLGLISSYLLFQYSNGVISDNYIDYSELMENPNLNNVSQEGFYILQMDNVYYASQLFYVYLELAIIIGCSSIILISISLLLILDALYKLKSINLTKP